MTDRGRRVYSLLRSLLDWAPPAAGGRSLADAGFTLRARRCYACETAGRPKPTPGGTPADCGHCHGTGEIPVRDPMDDPVKSPPSDPRRKVYYGGASGESLRDEARRRDALLAKLEAAKKVQDGEEAVDDVGTRIIAAHDRQYEHGSYAELEQLLEGWLRFYSPALYALAWSIAYQPFVEAPVDPPATWLKVGFLCELLAGRMPERIRVPVSVPVFGREELEARGRVERESLWRGRSVRHGLRRSERRALAVGLAADGVAPGEIGFRLGVHRRTVQRWLSEGSVSEMGGTAA